MMEYDHRVAGAGNLNLDAPVGPVRTAKRPHLPCHWIPSVRCQREWMQPLAAHETRVDLVPVQHARLAQLPAIVDLAPIDLPAKINQPGVHPFADDAEVIQLGDIPLDVPRETLRFHLQQLRDGIGMLGCRPDGRQLELADLVLPQFVLAHEVGDDPADQWQSSICFFDGEDSIHRSYCRWLDWMVKWLTAVPPVLLRRPLLQPT